MAENLSIRLADDLDFTSKDIDKQAKYFNMSRSAFIIKAIELMVNFDPVLIEKVDNLSKTLQIPSWLVMQNMLIKRFAQDAARAELGQSRIVYDEFLFTSNGVITGEELFNQIKQNEVKRLKENN